MASIKSIQNYQNCINFKSQIKSNDFFRAGLDATKRDLSMAGNNNTPRGLNIVKALEGLSNNGNGEFVEFLTKDKRVYTKVNGAIRNEYTFDATKDTGLDAQNAIIQYAKQTNSFHYPPLSKTEEKMYQLQNQLSEVKATLFKEMHRKIKIYY